MRNNLNGQKAESSVAQPLFQFNHETLRYKGREVLIDVDLCISAGETVALVGKSGSGKSTLLKAMQKQQPQTTAWCPQQANLVPMLSVFHNIFMGGLQRHNVIYNLFNLLKPLAKPLGEIARLVDKLQLRGELFSLVEQLSGGQQQRVSIGRALFQQQSVFLGDEPVSSVDSFQADTLLSLILHAHPTAVLALHDTEQALKICQRVIGLRQGRIVLDCATDTLTPDDLAFLYG